MCIVKQIKTHFQECPEFHNGFRIWNLYTYCHPFQQLPMLGQFDRNFSLIYTLSATLRPATTCLMNKWAGVLIC